MNRHRFVRLAVVAFGLVLLSFLVRGTARLVAGYETAVVLSAPILFAAAALVVVLVVYATLDILGIRPIE